MFKKLLLATLVAASLGVAPTYAPAANVVVVRTAPPDPRSENVPEARHGYVWAPGYWEWRGHRHVWVNGHWVRARHGYDYAPATWAERDGRWHFAPGHWTHAHADNDRDGIPNNRDAHPNNPNRS